MLTATLLLPRIVAAQDSQQTRLEGLAQSYQMIGQQFIPTESVGNLCGSGVNIPVFEELARAAPQTLILSFESAMATLTSRTIIAASSDYFEFRLESAGNRLDHATVKIAADVTNDQSIILLIARAIEFDLALAQQLVRDETLSISQFRIQMLQLREQMHLLQAEERRAEGGGAVYLPIQERSRRSLRAENVMLEGEVERLRAELLRVQNKSAELSEFILRQ